MLDITGQRETGQHLAFKASQLSALLEIGQAVAAALDLEVIYERVLRLVRPLIGAEALILFLHEDDLLEVVAVDRVDIPKLLGIQMPSHSGIAGEVWHSGKAVLLKGQEGLGRISPILKPLAGYKPQAVMAAPIRWRNTAVGVLEAVHRKPEAFDEEDMRLLETAAAWTAIAIGNAQQYDQLQRRLNERDAIAAISNALTETLELNTILQEIVEHVEDVVPNANWVAIHLREDDSERLALTASAGLDVEEETYFVDPGEGIIGHVMAAGGVLNVADMQTDPRRLPIDLSTNARSLLVAPVESRLGRLGTISVQCAAPSAFTADDERLLTILGVQAGMAIENARLFEAEREARTVAELRQARMQQMAQRIVEAQEDERARIARELHDESGQALTSLKISLEILRSQLPADAGDIRDGLSDALELTDKTMSNLRRLSHNLRPPGLDVYGVNAALDGLCHEFQAHTLIRVTYDGADLPDISALTGLSLYRVTQEALTNAAKHARATEITVTLAQNSDHIRLTVVDDGRGFQPPDLETLIPARGAGLVGMMERLEMVDGRLVVESAPGSGCRVTALVPYAREAT